MLLFTSLTRFTVPEKKELYFTLKTKSQILLLDMYFSHWLKLARSSLANPIKFCIGISYQNTIWEFSVNWHLKTWADGFRMWQYRYDLETLLIKDTVGFNLILAQTATAFPLIVFPFVEIIYNCLGFFFLTACKTLANLSQIKGKIIEA